MTPDLHGRYAWGLMIAPGNRKIYYQLVDAGGARIWQACLMGQEPEPVTDPKILAAIEADQAHQAAKRRPDPASAEATTS